MSTKGKEGRASILVVDDDRGPRRAARAGRLRRARGPSGAEALAALTARAIDVVLSDVRMPGMDGLELLAAAKKRAPDVPVILITAHGTIPLAVEAMKAGAAEFLLDAARCELERALAARETCTDDRDSRHAARRRGASPSTRLMDARESPA